MSRAQLWGATGFGLVALFLALRFWDPAAAGGPDLCLFHRLSGIACPACGLTRAASSLAHGDLIGAVGWHPLSLLLAIESGLVWLAWGWALSRRRSSQALGRWATGLALANGLLLLVVWIVRLGRGTLPV